MAFERYNIENNPIDASADKNILIPIDGPFYGIQINYSGFVPGAGTLFKLHRYFGSNPVEAEFSEIADTETIIADGSGIVTYKNGTPETATFYFLEYVADGNDPASEYSIITNFRN